MTYRAPDTASATRRIAAATKVRARRAGAAAVPALAVEPEPGPSRRRGAATGRRERGRRLRLVGVLGCHVADPHRVGAPRLEVALDAPEIGAQVGRALVAQLAVLLEAVVDDLLHPDRQLRVEERRRHGRLHRQGVGAQ